MQETTLEDRFAKRSRPLIHALIISVALNLGLLATFITFILKEKKVETLLQAQTAPKPAGVSTSLLHANAQVLEEYAKTSFIALVKELQNDELLQQGYRRRDLALACLVAFHHFDLERALPGVEIQRRPFLFGNSEKQVELIPGLNEGKFQVIDYFATREKWPLTTEGLFEEMKHRKNDLPESLKEAFFLSHEFYLIERAFSRFPFVFSKETLLHLLLDGSWQQIEGITNSIQKNPKGEIEAIGPLLAGFDQSKLAVYLLIALDPDYPFLQFSDKRLEQLISFLDQRTDEAQAFLSRIATSARSDEMRAKAEERVQSWGGEVPKMISSEEYIIQKGDSLWGLSRQFDVSMEKIREVNDLNSDILTPGKILKIPHAYLNEGEPG